MRILVSNDDGFHAEGIQVLAKELRKIADVVIVAPDRNRSAASSSLTLVEPLRPRHLDSGDYCVNGTPADCVHLALNGFLSGQVDLVVSALMPVVTWGMIPCIQALWLQHWKAAI